jgi:hypothetical protein
MAGLKVMNYLWFSKDKKLVYEKKASWKLTVYADASFGTCEDRKSIGGYIILLNDTAITWRCYKQKIVANSAAEAEYVALNEAVRNLMWIMNMLTELGFPIHEKPTVYEDNQSTIMTVKGQKNGMLTKHLEVKFQYVKEVYEKGKFELLYLNTKDQIANVLTKCVGRDETEYFLNTVGIIDDESPQVELEPIQGKL